MTKCIEHHVKKNDRTPDKAQSLVSIIIPAYNCERFIGITLNSVIGQTYSNWEAIVIDDYSTDNTGQIVKKYAERDSRIKYHRLIKNSGAAIARNTGVELCEGEFIAFLDSDDVWYPQKLSKQISFMRENGYMFTCTSYGKIDEDGSQLNTTIVASIKQDYNGILKNCPGNSTVIYNCKKLGKFKIPNIRKRNDYVMWLQIIKKAVYIYGLDEVLGSHRIRKGSLSRNKMGLIKYHWQVYRHIEHLSVIKSINLICYLCFKKVLRIK
ncbi:glycosyltransferase family 2 protein [Clostridium oryzae]|uniref:Putative teichuronic acid biosynthesis glycosyltransferase TuaG n=1 Tax=Clostridium oryzae TaxID=1450648 RepID=A0A1V4IQ91_9CLOT|nr:glycosyltransferase family 2 protein [Clostridium oryzae]OPJ61647.1 putative teichuronic acid biosynthesis glycosyltransferase TuaG [Clostridium oryzae]